MSVKLKYIGTSRYIPMIPMRDLTDFDVENLVSSNERTVRDLVDEQQVIDYLLGSGLYELSNEFTCHECDRAFKTWQGLSKHELTHIEELRQSLEIEEE